MIFELPDNRIWFPDPELAEEDGLLAVGGDLSPQRLIAGYQSAIFPWFSEETPILWYSPHERFVLFPERLKVSDSLKKVIKKGWFDITFNAAFEEVIDACAKSPRKEQDGTWITSDMKQAYVQLHYLGHAHSVEVWNDGVLVGGLYGVQINNVFCGESMFSKVSNTSKVALSWLCKEKTFRMIDCQIHSPHLESMGAEIISRSRFLEILNSPQ